MKHTIIILSFALGVTNVLPGAEIRFNRWDRPLEDHWRCLDGTHEGYEGVIHPGTDVIRLTDGRGDVTRGAMLRNDLAFIPQGPVYRVDVQLKLMSVGSHDSGSATKSFVKLYFSVAGIGLDMSALSEDRIVIDPDWSQYQMVRNDGEFHIFTFLVDTERKWIRLRKDGIPLGFYRAHDLSEPGIRIAAMGSEGTPCEIEIATISVADAEWDNPPATQVAPVPLPSVEPAEWPAYLRDTWNTSRSPLHGAGLPLREIASFSIGGNRLRDVFIGDINDDGTNEIVLQFGGRYRAYDSTGNPLWEYTADGMILGTYDLDGDGDTELLIQSAGVPFVALDGGTGRVEYRDSAHKDIRMGCVKVFEGGASAPGMKIVFFPALSDIGYVYRFDAGKKEIVCDAELHIAPEARGFTPELALADMNDDGVFEAVVVTYDRLYAFNLNDGSILMQAQWDSGRNYGELVVTDIDGDPFPEVVIGAYEVREHLAVIDNDGREFRVLWDRFFEQNYPNNDKDFSPCFNPVQDFDGDGMMEIVASLYNDGGDERWHTLLFDALTGETRYDVADVKAECVVAPASSSIPWMVLTHAVDRTQFEGVTLYNPKQGTFAVDPDATLVKDLSVRGIPSMMCVSGVGGTDGEKGPHSRAMALSGAAEGVFWVWDGHRLRSVSITDRSKQPFHLQSYIELPAGPSLNIRAVQDRDGDGAPEVFVSSGHDSRLRVYDGKSKQVVLDFPAGGDRRIPLCARMTPDAAELTVFVVAGAGRLQAWRGVKTNPELIFEIPIQPRVANLGPPTITLCDLDGDGTKEILTGLPGNQMAILDMTGEIRRTWKLDAPAIDWVAGRFTDDDMLDIVVTTSPRITEMKTYLLDPLRSNEAPVWANALGAYYGWPAVYDANGDGYDDIILRYFFMRHILDGRNGLDLVPIEWIQGYHCPSLIFPDGRDREPLIVWSGGGYTHRVERLDGSVIWTRWAQSMLRVGCLGDFDGDGRVESAYQTIGTLYDLGTQFDNLKFEPLAESNSGYVFTCEAQTGRETGAFDLGESIIEGLIAMDVDGDGRDEILAGTKEGFLHVLGIEDSRLQSEWSHDFGASVSRPTAADLDLDGRPEILVGDELGTIHVLGFQYN